MQQTLPTEAIDNDKAICIADSWAEAQAIRGALRCVLGVDVSLRTWDAVKGSYLMTMEHPLKTKAMRREIQAAAFNIARGVAFQFKNA